ncbi:MAG: hypothetical protein V4701_01645 [Pseudomonadota bacterium]
MKSLQIAAALGAAIAFVLAIMAVGVMLLSLMFAMIGALLVAWLAYGVARPIMERRLQRERLAAAGPPAT